MKNIWTCFLVLVLIVPTLHAQEKLLGILPAKDGKIIYSGKVEVPGASGEILYARAKSWFDTANKNSTSKIASATSEGILGDGKYKIRAKGVGLVGYDVDVLYKVNLQFDEDGYRYFFTDFIGQTDGKFGPVEDTMENWNSEWQEEEKRASKNAKVYPQVNKGMIVILESLEKAMTSEI